MISYASVMTYSCRYGQRLSVQSLDNADVPLAGVTECLQRLLIGRAVMSCDGLSDAVELRHSKAPSNPLLIGLCGVTASEEAAAVGDDGRPRKLCIPGQRRRIGDGAIEGDPVSCGHL